MTLAFADGEKVTVANKERLYDMSVKPYRLAAFLELDLEQRDAVEMIHGRFCDDMMKVARASEEKQRKMFEKALNRDLGYMRYVLDRQQYRKYLQLLNVTLQNRGLIE